MKCIALVLVTIALLLCDVGQAGASVITSLPGGTVVPMPAVNDFSSGPEVFGPNITWTSTNSFAVFGYTGGYGFGGNGFWDGGLGPMAGVNSSTDTMTFTFNTPVSAVGGFLNYAPGVGSASISVFDTSNNLIETFPLTFVTDGSNNTGAFFGFQETTPIGSFALTGAYVGLVDLTIQQAVPEPTSLALFGLASLTAGYFGLRRRKAVLA